MGGNMTRRPSLKLITIANPSLCVAFATHDDDGKHGDEQHTGNNSDNDRGAHFEILSPLLSVGAWLKLRAPRRYPARLRNQVHTQISWWESSPKRRSKWRRPIPKIELLRRRIPCWTPFTEFGRARRCDYVALVS